MLPLFLLGFLHVLQPGHAQALWFTSLSLSNFSLSKLLKISLWVGLVHTLFLLGLAFSFNSFIQQYHDILHDFESAFSFMVLLVGLWVLWKYTKKKPESCYHSPVSKSLLYSIVGISALPCPSNVTFLVTQSFTYSSNFWIGFFAYTAGIIASMLSANLLIYLYGRKLMNAYLSKDLKIIYLLIGMLIIFIGLWMGAHPHGES